MKQKKADLLALLGSKSASVSTAFDKVFSAASENQSVSFADPYRIEKQFDSLPKIDLPKLLKSLSKNRLESMEIQKELYLIKTDVEIVTAKNTAFRML